MIILLVAFKDGFIFLIKGGISKIEFFFAFRIIFVDFVVEEVPVFFLLGVELLVFFLDSHKFLPLIL